MMCEKEFVAVNEAEVLEFIKSESLIDLEWHAEVLQLLKLCFASYPEADKTPELEIDAYFIDKTLECVNAEIKRRCA